MSSEAISRYFYSYDRQRPSQTLYELLGATGSADLSELRTAWRIRKLEIGVQRADPAKRVALERAFNIVAQPELRSCYDNLIRDDNATALFPYGGFGAILAEGNVSADGRAFFADRILAYKPEMTVRKEVVRLRCCEILADRITWRDSRRKDELALDATLLQGPHWDLTWNRWKHWLRSRIIVDATFVRSGKYRFRQGEWSLVTWNVALPSRIRVSVPGDLSQDIEQARNVDALLGRNTGAIEIIRTALDQRPLSRDQVEGWFDRLGASPGLSPEYVSWQPDYDRWCFEELRKRSTNWYLFRREYLFDWAHVLLSEIPQAGHATYVFAKPNDIRDFLRKYAQSTREDLRRNRDRAAGDLGFIGRVIRGRNRKGWLTNLLKLAGEKKDSTEVFE